MSEKAPNIVFVLADDLGAWSLGCAGNPEIHTPNIDSIAENGIRFENFFCASPVCSPARASILTSMMPSGHGVLDWLCSGGMDGEKFGVGELAQRYCSERKPIRFLEGLHTYPEVLHQSGYRCALSGKWHVGDHIRPAPGFTSDYWYTIGQGGCPYFAPDIVENGTVTIKEEYITDLITDRALLQLENLAKDEKPFYLSVHYTAPHCPWDANSHPTKYIDLYKDCAFDYTPSLPLHPNQTDSSPNGATPETRRECLAGYYAAITAMDDGIGQILRKLEQLGCQENTIVVFTSDNGVCMGHHGVWGKGNATYPQNMYEESVKVPCVIQGPGIPKGIVAKGMYSHCDWYPTLLECAGIQKVPQNICAVGESFASLLQGRGESELRSHICVFEEYGDVRMVRSETYKYVSRTRDGECELYCLKNDPKETHNLVNEEKFKPVQNQMAQLLRQEFERCTVIPHSGRNNRVTGKGQLNIADGSVKAFALATGLLKKLN